MAGSTSAVRRLQPGRRKTRRRRSRPGDPPQPAAQPRLALRRPGRSGVSRRTPRRRTSSTTSANSRSRPIRRVGCGGRLVGRAFERRERREIALQAFADELEDPLRPAEVLQPCSPRSRARDSREIVLGRGLGRTARRGPGRRDRPRRCAQPDGRPFRRSPRLSSAARRCGCPCARGSAPASAAERRRPRRPRRSRG